MKRMMFTTTLAISAIWMTGEFVPAEAQQVVLAPQPYLYAAPATTYYPTASYTTVQTYRKRGPLRLLPRRDEVVTTSYVEVPRRVITYPAPAAPVRTYTTTTYPVPVRTYTTTTYRAPVYVAPAPVYVAPARIIGW